MLSDAILVGVTLTICGILEAQVSYFKTDTGLLWIKLIVFFITGGLYVLNGFLFGTTELTKTVIMGYLSTGLTLGAVSSGIFSVGEATINANKPAEKAARLQRKIAKAQSKLLKMNGKIAK